MKYNLIPGEKKKENVVTLALKHFASITLSVVVAIHRNRSLSPCVGDRK